MHVKRLAYCLGKEIAITVIIFFLNQNAHIECIFVFLYHIVKGRFERG